MLKNVLCILIGLFGLVAAASAQPNTIDCSAFSKRPDGTWYVGAPTTFDVGQTTSITVAARAVGHNFMNIAGDDLFDLIEAKCGNDQQQRAAPGHAVNAGTDH
ncbi:hypothetical protein ABIF38_005031 [Bradyrhizobium japonicum]|uniref:hypothetical protein n=1 Tax=Bradyrhizobium elkanii TaxID=29448 RepID=UPI000373D908|nr:hypothetical protein [Bradyrhizobium elkanii]MCP1732656.1 hypothetical protein [Bradyrhizobium elkanii]MCS3567994.1 hypothetical protein [Bradyrhizobium elkanii]MCS3590523.1 hypothetical protein [Bradyrhizobium elkanii]MCS3619966.1 hypothetical protein [Bradyrhizobium elkanii]MCW2111780.1 hypothetical protein [Bradyrhizobium elkanii]